MDGWRSIFLVHGMLEGFNGSDDVSRSGLEGFSDALTGGEREVGVFFNEVTINEARGRDGDGTFRSE